jgi:hypothetical protein
MDYERLSPYLTFRPHDVIQNTLRQTTQLAKSTINYPMRRHLKSRFQMLEVMGTDTYKGVDDSIQHTRLVEWNNINNSQSWVNCFALCLSNPAPVISYARDQKLLDKSPYCHLIPSCSLYTDEDLTRYRSIIGCCICVIVLGRCDIAYATTAI